MIPSQGERQVRPCIVCVFCYSDRNGTGCTREKDVSPDGDVRNEMDEPFPCISHFTADEMDELIDVHNWLEGSV